MDHNETAFLDSLNQIAFLILLFIHQEFHTPNVKLDIQKGSSVESE